MDEATNLLLKQILDSQRYLSQKVDEISSNMVYKKELEDVVRRLDAFALQRELERFETETSSKFIEHDIVLEQYKRSRFPGWFQNLVLPILGTLVVNIFAFGYLAVHPIQLPNPLPLIGHSQTVSP